MAISEDPGLASPASAGGRRLDLRALRLGLVNAVLSGLLVVVNVAYFVFGGLPVGDSAGILMGIMLVFLIPLAFFPIGISCLRGVVRFGNALRIHSSREARIGLWLSLGGLIAVIACYVFTFGIGP